MIDRIDEVQKYYDPAKRLNTWLGRLFWGSAFLSFIVLYVTAATAKQILSTTFIITTLAYFMLSQYNRFYLIPRAEHERRRQLLTDAFGIPLTHNRTQGYYNNPVTPTIVRLGANTLENTFFTKHITYEMAKRERVRVLLYGFLWVTALILRTTDLALILILTQVVFSAEIIVKFVNIEVLRARTEAAYNYLHHQFLHGISPNDNSDIANILQAFASYESAKAAAALVLSSEIFKRLNPELSAEWERIRQDLKINNAFTSG